MNVRINDDWHSWKAWVFDKEQAPHGPMLFEMTHFTDMCNWFMAAEPKEVVAMETSMLNHSIIITYETGEIATLGMYSNGTFGYPKELYEMFGHGAAVIVDHMAELRTVGIADAPACKTYPLLNDRHPNIGKEGGIRGWLTKKQQACNEAAQTNDPLKQFAAEPDKGHARAIDSFVDEIQGQTPPVCPVDDAIMATRVAFAAIKSTKEKRIVTLAEV